MPPSVGHLDTHHFLGRLTAPVSVAPGRKKENTKQNEERKWKQHQTKQTKLSQQSTLTVVENGNLNGNLKWNQNRKLKGNLNGNLIGKQDVNL